MSRHHFAVSEVVAGQLKEWKDKLFSKKGVPLPISWNNFFLLVSSDALEGRVKCPHHHGFSRCRICMEMLMYE